MAFSNDLRVNILGDTKGLERSFARANQATATFGRNVEGVGSKVDKTTRSLKGFAAGAGAGFAGAVAAGAALQGVRASVDVASNLAEQISKTNVVFGKSADEIKAWAGTTAESIGIANDQALAAASTFGAMFDQAGASSADAARFSKIVTQLAADLASFNNTSIDESLTALRSGLSGEIEPLRRFQVFLTEAAVSQRALEDSNKSSVKQLTQGEKILARYNLILEQTAKQQGDFERTSDGLANKQRILAARFRDAQADLGQGLMPVMETLVTVAGDATTGIAALSDGLQALGSIKVPFIDIPFRFINKSAGGDGITLGDLGKFVLETNVVSVTKDVIDIWDDSWKEQVPKLGKALGDIQAQAIEDALSLAGTFGITPLGGSGEQFAAQFASGIAAAIAFAQAEAARVIAEGQARIARQSGLDNAELGLIIAQGTVNNLQDDLTALRAIAASLQKQIKAGQDVVANQKRLAEIQNQIAATQRQIAENRKAQDRAARESARAQTQARQFRALGLAASGEEIIPGIKNLQQRINGALRRINSGELDVSSKLVERLKLARALIKKEGKNLTDETRQVINDLIKTVTQGTKDLDEKGGDLTKTTSLNVKKVLEGLGLTPEAERELRARLSGVNSAGRQLAGDTRPTGRFRTPKGSQASAQGDVFIDGQRVGTVVRKDDERNAKRNPKQKRGPRSGV